MAFFGYKQVRDGAWPLLESGDGDLLRLAAAHHSVRGPSFGANRLLPLTGPTRLGGVPWKSFNKNRGKNKVPFFVPRKSTGLSTKKLR